MKPLIPRTPNQLLYVKYLRDVKIPITFGVGSAGTGKTLIASHVGLEYLLSKKCNKIVLTRPTVNAGNDLGALPGCLENKMSPWLSSIYQHFYRSIGEEHTKSLLKTRKIEIVPLEFCRGRSFDNSFVIADECQNVTKNQMLMLLTRIEEDSRLVITGDTDQSDIVGINGLQHFIDIHEKYGECDFIKIIKFLDDDIQRSEIVKQVLRIYKNT